MRMAIVFGLIGLLVGAGVVYAVFHSSVQPTKAVEESSIEPLRQQIAAEKKLRLEETLQLRDLAEAEKKLRLEETLQLRDLAEAEKKLRLEETLQLCNLAEAEKKLRLEETLQLCNLAGLVSGYANAKGDLHGKCAKARISILQELSAGWMDINKFKKNNLEITESVSEIIPKLDKLTSLIDITDILNIKNASYPFLLKMERETELLDSLDKSVKEMNESIKSYDFSVYGNEDWKSSDAQVSKGDLFIIKVVGKIKLTNRDYREDITVDAASGTNALAEYRQCSDVGTGAMLARIRGGGVYMANTAGWSRIYKADGSGRLEFRINDTDVRDNSGTASVQIIVLPLKEWNSWRENVVNAIQ